MFDRLKQEKLFIHSIVFLISGILSFTLLNILFPLVVYRSLIKLIILGSGMLLGLLLNYFLYDRYFHPILKDMKKYWLRSSLIALAVTFLIISLSPSCLPYYPVEHQIKIETNSSGFGFLGAKKVIKDGFKVLIDPELFQFSGEWDHHPSFHQGVETGVIEYKHVEYIRHSLQYEFSFAQSNFPTSATITIDGEAHTIEIEAVEQEAPPIPYRYQLIAPEKDSSSLIWQAIILIFPYLVILSVFITTFFGVAYILSRKESFWMHAAQILLFVIAEYLFVITVNFQNDVFNYLTQTFLWAIVALILMVFVPVLFGLMLKKKPQSILAFLIIILLIGIGLRVYWIVMVPSAQVSDFGRFHNWALQIANHEPDIVIDRYADFTRALALLYRLFPTHVAVEILNIIYSVGTMLCLYWIGKINQHEKIGVIAAYWLAIYLPHISMTSLVNTDTPGIFFLVLSVLLVQLAAVKKSRIWWYLAAAGAAFALCIFVRGAMILYLPVLVVVLSLHPKKKGFTFLKQLGVVLVAAILFHMSFSQGIQLVKSDGLVIDEIRYLMWPLVKGVNVEKLGRENLGDTQMVLEWPAEEVNHRGFQVVMNRIFSDPLRFYSILKDKYEYQFANAVYGVDLVFYDESHEFFDFQTGWNVDIKTVRETYAQVAQYSYLILLVLAVWASLHTTSGNAGFWIPAAAVLFCAFAAYTFFEVQPRYSQPIIPFLMLLSALSFNEKKSAHEHELPS